MDGSSATSCSTNPHGSPEVQRRDSVLRRLKLAATLCLVFLLVEAVGGWLAGSLAILSDAAHLLADLAAFLVAIGAAHLASLPSTESHTFGLKRTESLAALFSMVSLALVSVGLAVEAIHRLVDPPEEGIDGKLMSGIATIGVLVNVVLAFVLGTDHVHMPGAGGHDHDHSHDHGHGHGHNHGGGRHEEEGYGAVHHSDEVCPEESDGNHNHCHHKKERNVNLQAAYLHVLGDLAQSAAVLIAGLVIWVAPSWRVVDPICTLFFCCLVFYSTLSVLRSSIAVLLQEVPPNVSWKAIHTQIEAVEGVTEVHDLHIWSISQGIPSLSVHVMALQGTRSAQELLCDINGVCKQNGVHHATVQIQCEGDSCVTCDGGNSTCVSFDDTNHTTK